MLSVLNVDSNESGYNISARQQQPKLYTKKKCVMLMASAKSFLLHLLYTSLSLYISCWVEMNDRIYTVLAFTHCAAYSICHKRANRQQKKKRRPNRERVAFMHKTILPNLVTWGDTYNEQMKTQNIIFSFLKKKKK